MRLQYSHRVLFLALLSSLPGVVVSLVLLWRTDWSTKSQDVLTMAVLGAWFGFAHLIRVRVLRPLQTVYNMVTALREGDFSLRVRGTDSKDVLGLLLFELNSLGEDLRSQRLNALEATALLRRVMEEVDVAVFAFDADRRLRLLNRAGERLLGPAERTLNRGATELGLASCLEGGALRVLDLEFQGQRRRWEVRRGSFRQGGLPHELLVLSDVSQTLSEEERQAWRRLIRVLGHELNNSLAPIKSIAQSLNEMVQRHPPPTDWREDLRKGLDVIGGRAESLSRLMGAYAGLARLPPPRLEPVRVADWVRRVAALETRREVTVHDGPDVTIQADGGQLDQALINLVRNAVDATLDCGGQVEAGWEVFGRRVEVWVRDEGTGLPQTANLFVPFFTTKPGGSGIGLVLSRQIAEAHGGMLTLVGRSDSRGSEARLFLPIREGLGDSPQRS
jgi:two-component system, NtrC family, nitrogen regulation sensor histidine kinase NtrY